MLDQGVYLAPSAYEAGFTSIDHDDEIVSEIITAGRNAFQKL
jgi:glutamate-1-semialdehyde 2,1-aminomutase